MQRVGLSLTTCPILVNSLHYHALLTSNFPFKRLHNRGFSKRIKVGNFIKKCVISHGYAQHLTDHTHYSRYLINYDLTGIWQVAHCWWCRRQDSNLRTVTDWDLIPAPLTKLGDSCCISNGITRVYQHIQGCGVGLFSDRASLKICAIHYQWQGNNHAATYRLNADHD